MDAAAEGLLPDSSAMTPSIATPSRPGADYRVRIMESRDLARIVEVHCQQFPDGFYTRLGPGFMTAYFSAYVRSPGAVGLVAEQHDGSDIVGYLIGTVDDAAHERHMHGRAAPALTASGALALVRRPGLWKEFLRHRSVWYLRRHAAALVRTRRPAPAEREGELLYICTTSGNRRRGIGAALLRGFVEAAQRAHTTGLHLVAEKNNTPAHDFYAHRGWQVVSESMTRDRRPLVRMRLSLGGTAS